MSVEVPSRQKESRFMTEFLWQLQDVSLTTAGVTRLQNINLVIQGGVTAVIGYSGAGKTSLLNLLAAMERPTHGSVIRSFPQTASKLPLYWVPQDGGLWPHWTVHRHLMAVSPQQSASGRDHDLSDFIDELLNQFDLKHRQQAFPGDLSMGERSRLAVARSLATRANVLVMDEPLSHVDTVRRPAYWNIIRKQLKQNQTSLVFSTHEPETAIRESESAICLSDGRVLYAGSTMELYRHPESAEVARFLGPINWFSEQEAALWLKEEPPVKLALRPEQIRVLPDEQADTQVVAFRFCGNYAETTLQKTKSTEQRTIVHRPTATDHQPGQHVRLEVIS
jgi:iron(III) transport system ATP-binding protein